MSTLLQVWAVLKVYHPLLSAVFRQQQPILAIPRVINLLSLYIYVLSIVLSSLIHLVYVVDSQELYTVSSAAKYGIIFFACLIVIRPIAKKI